MLECDLPVCREPRDRGHDFTQDQPNPRTNADRIKRLLPLTEHNFHQVDGFGMIRILQNLIMCPYPNNNINIPQETMV